MQDSFKQPLLAIKFQLLKDTILDFFKKAKSSTAGNSFADQLYVKTGY